MNAFPVGKLPTQVLARLLDEYTLADPRVILGPGIGLDCAVIDFGERALVLKSDPITFTAEGIGWYAVHVNANDVATTGAEPKWFLATLLLPEGENSEEQVAAILDQISDACHAVGAVLVGGHTEITAGIDRPIVVGTMVGEVERQGLITPQGARPGDVLLLTKGVPIEATSIMASDFSSRLKDVPKKDLVRARAFLYDPGISVVKEALAAVKVEGVGAMHDPTEGGLSTGVWELAEASQVGIELQRQAIFIPPESLAICTALEVDPLEAIASGALLLSVRPEASEAVQKAIETVGVQVFAIGRVVAERGVAMRTNEETHPLPWPKRDALAKLFE